MNKNVNGFSKFSKEEKINWLTENYLDGNIADKSTIEKYWNEDDSIQTLHDEFSENTISNFYLPFGIAPNFLINDQQYALPMATEESSVVAAAAGSAKFWQKRGGFKTEILSFEKVGHVHFSFDGNANRLKKLFKEKFHDVILRESKPISQNMRNRGGGVTRLALVDKTHALENYFQLEVGFDTVDAMGANFINTVLEQMAKTLETQIESDAELSKAEHQTILCILSNYTPNCLVRAEVNCAIKDLAEKGTDPEVFAKKFDYAIKIANAEPSRATTHNKGIMNGVDALVIATGNDFRAVEACAHTFASRTGTYKSLTHCDISNNLFRFWMDLPIALGTVGGLTQLHPLVKVALKILKSPNAKELMGIVAVAGLAQNFAAIKSLVTTGIQQGHMKMHLFNILNQFEATEEEKKFFINHFKDKTVSYHNVELELKKIRLK